MHNRILINEEEGMLNIPKHRWSFIVNYSLPKRFNLWSRVYYQSSTRWINFQGAAFTFDNETIKYVNVSNMFNLDVGVSKKIAKDYLNLNLSVRNLLNTAQKYHTIGAQFDLTFFVGVSGNISAFAKK
jgi:outer membrane receptor for ferrienterochelin and colicin